MKLSELIAPLDGTAARVALANIASILGSSYDWNGDHLEAIAEEITRLGVFPPVSDQSDDIVDMWENVDWSA